MIKLRNADIEHQCMAIIIRYYVNLTKSIKLIHGHADHSPTVFVATGDGLPRHPKKMEEPQTVVSALLRLINVVY